MSERREDTMGRMLGLLTEEEGAPAEIDLNAYNTELAKIINKRIKKDLGADAVRQNYKGTGRQSHRRQLWVHKDNPRTVVDLWLDTGFLGIGGILRLAGLSGEAANISYEGRTPEQVYSELVTRLKPHWPQK